MHLVNKLDYVLAGWQNNHFLKNIYYTTTSVMSFLVVFLLFSYSKNEKQELCGNSGFVALRAGFYTVSDQLWIACN